MTDYTKRAGHRPRRGDSFPLKEASVFGVTCLFVLMQSPAVAAAMQAGQTPAADQIPTSQAAAQGQQQPPKLRKPKKVKRYRAPQTNVPAGTPLAAPGAGAPVGAAGQAGAAAPVAGVGAGAQIQGAMALPAPQAAPGAADQPAPPLAMGAGVQGAQPGGAQPNLGHTLPAPVVPDNNGPAVAADNANAGPVAAQNANGGEVSTAQQAGVESAFRRDRNVSVAERPHPEYAALGLRLGTFVGTAKLVTDLTYDDNVFPKTPVTASDLIVHVHPEVTFASDWGRNSVSAYVKGTENWYTHYSDQSTTDGQIGADARVDLTALTNVSFGASSGVTTVPRTDASTQPDAQKPYQYTLSSIYAQGIEERDRWRFTQRVDFGDYSYYNVPSTLGGNIIENYQNHDSYTLSGKTEYALAQNFAVYGNFHYLDHQFERQPGDVGPIGTSTGYEATVGADFDLTHLARGSVEVGYLDQQFRYAQYGHAAGAAIHATIEWFPTQLTTVTFKADRAVQEWAVVGSGGSLGTFGTLQVDHELFRNIRLMARAHATEYDYNGVARKDLIATWDAGVTYLMNRRIGVDLTATRLEQWSSGAAKGPDFADDRVTLALTVQY